MAAPRPNPREFAYRDMLLDLNKLITPQELESMKFYVKGMGVVGQTKRNIQTSLDLWEKLEERNHLSRNNLIILKTILQKCTDNRCDVLEVVTRFEKSEIKDSPVTPEEKELEKLIRFLVDNLGKDWKFFMRSLGLKEPILEMCIDSHPNRVREQIFAAFAEWKDDQANKDSLIRALKDVKRNDLIRDINSGNY